MELTETDLETVRTIAENLGPLSKVDDDNTRHLASQVIKLCNILTGDDVKIIDPSKTEPFDQEKAMARHQKAMTKAAQNDVQ